MLDYPGQFDKVAYQRAYMKKYRANKLQHSDAPLGYAVFAQSSENKQGLHSVEVLLDGKLATIMVPEPMFESKWIVTSYLVPPKHLEDAIDPIPCHDSMVAHAYQVLNMAKRKLHKNEAVVPKRFALCDVEEV